MGQDLRLKVLSDSQFEATMPLNLRNVSYEVLARRSKRRSTVYLKQSAAEELPWPDLEELLAHEWGHHYADLKHPTSWRELLKPTNWWYIIDLAGPWTLGWTDRLNLFELSAAWRDSEQVTDEILAYR